MKRSIILVASTLLVSIVAVCLQCYLLERNSYDSTDPMLIKINEIRAEAGKPVLKAHRSLDTSASMKARDLVERGYWSHDTPDNKRFSELIYSQFPYASSVGENLARCADDPVAAWVDSPAHYANIIGDWRYWGAGLYSSDECLYVVNHFSR